MFGYVVPDKQNMLIKDYSLYRAYYCGLCREIGKTAGQRFRMTINYDITFLALLAENLAGEQPKIEQKKCVVHPIGKISMVGATDVLKKIVHVNTLIGYYKAADDAFDESSTMKRAAKVFLKGEYQKARRILPSFDQTLKTEYARLNGYERDGGKGLDELADPFSQIMVKMGECFVKQEKCAFENAENFFRLCYNLGRWIYFIDALDDIDKDFKEGAFNPFLQGVSELTEEKREEIFKIGAEALGGALSVIQGAYDKMEITVSEGPLSNIVYLGLKKRQEDIISKRGRYGKKSIFGTRGIRDSDTK